MLLSINHDVWRVSLLPEMKSHFIYPQGDGFYRGLLVWLCLPPSHGGKHSHPSETRGKPSPMKATFSRVPSRVLSPVPSRVPSYVRCLPCPVPSPMPCPFGKSTRARFRPMEGELFPTKAPRSGAQLYPPPRFSARA